MRKTYRTLTLPSMMASALGAVALAPALAGPTVDRSSRDAGVELVAYQPGGVLRPRPEVLPVADYELTAHFGDTSGLWSEAHTGTDFAAPAGTPVRAIAAGRVVSAEYDGAYGLTTVVRLAGGTDIWFCHQTEVTVARGDVVAPGQVIGTVGSTGNVTGPHLHLEIHAAGEGPVDPEQVLARWGLEA